jgi:hypothetical protein
LINFRVDTKFYSQSFNPGQHQLNFLRMVCLNRKRPTKVGIWAADQIFCHNFGHFLSKNLGKIVKNRFFFEF